MKITLALVGVLAWAATLAAQAAQLSVQVPRLYTLSGQPEHAIVQSDGSITVSGQFAGSDGGGVDFYGTADGSGTAARFSNPNGVAVDSAGNLYVADFYFNTIRKGFPAPKILNSGFNLGQFNFTLTGSTGQLVVIEASTDLVSWLSIWTNTFARPLSFSDPQNGSLSHRFYRAHLP